MSTQVKEKQIPRELPKESWNNKPEVKPFDSETGNQLQQWIKDAPISEGSDFFKMKDGESLDLVFDVRDPRNKWETRKGFPKLNPRTNKVEERDETKFNFVVWSSHADKAQIWRPSNTTTALIHESMQEYNTNEFIVTRKGSDMSTRYFVKPTGLKPAWG